jgi:hypothetical protein
LSTRVLKIEIRDDEGNKITVSFKGRLTRNKALHFLDFVGLLGGVASNRAEDGNAPSDLSKFKKLQLVIKRRFPLGWFTSQEALVAYEDILNEPMGLSTVSTYLARLADQGFLSRQGSRVRRRYKMKERPSIQEKQRIPP